MGFIWQRRALLREPQQDAGLDSNQIVNFLIFIIKAPPWTGGVAAAVPTSR